MSRFVVKESAAKMPLSCWGKYARVAVMEIEDDAAYPKMISTRAKGVIRVVETWESLYVGTTERCALWVATIEATALCDKLNSTLERLAEFGKAS